MAFRLCSPLRLVGLSSPTGSSFGPLATTTVVALGRLPALRPLSLGSTTTTATTATTAQARRLFATSPLEAQNQQLAPPPAHRRARFRPHLSSLVLFAGTLLLGGIGLSVSPVPYTIVRLYTDRDGSFSLPLLKAIFAQRAEQRRAQEASPASASASGFYRFVDYVQAYCSFLFAVPDSAHDRLLREDVRAWADRSPVGALLHAMEADPAWEEWTVGQRWTDASKDVNKDVTPTIATTATQTTSRYALSADSHLVSLPHVFADLPPDDHTTVPDPPSKQRLTSGTLGGVRGMSGYHRIFYHRSSGEIVSVLFLGPALCGWPFIAHGGALATILDEALGRCAIRALPAQTGVTARLELAYRRPVSVPGFYVVRSKPEAPADPNAPSNPNKLWCSAVLESADGVPCVQARGLFVVPRKYKLGRVVDKF